MRRLCEPKAPSVSAGIKTLAGLHSSGIRTYAMIAPMLPKSKELVAVIKGKVDYILIDGMNYHYGDWVHRKYKLESSMQDGFFHGKNRELAPDFEKEGIQCQVLF